MLPVDDLSCDILILGAGGAGMLAALHVTTANPAARIVIAVKGLIGQSGCTRKVLNCPDRRAADIIRTWTQSSASIRR